MIKLTTSTLTALPNCLYAILSFECIIKLSGNADIRKNRNEAKNFDRERN